MKPQAQILVADDEPDTLELVGFNLKAAGFDVLTTSNGREAIQLALEARPALIVLDIMLPEMDGWEVCKTLRNTPACASLPIIMLTARTGEFDRVLALELGADDYLTKPFSPRELILRVKNLLRQQGPRPEPGTLLRAGPLEIDLERHQSRLNGTPLKLTAKEFKLLTLLVQRCGRLQSRKTLLQEVWDYDAPGATRTVDAHIARLRKKLGPASDLIESVHGIGYRLRFTPASPASAGCFPPYSSKTPPAGALDDDAPTK